jgi:hypothetical protein
MHKQPCRTENAWQTQSGQNSILFQVIIYLLLMTQVVDFLLHFLDKHNIKHNFYFCGRGVVKSPFVLWQASSLLICHTLLAALILNWLLIIWPRFTWTVLTLTNRSSKPLWTVLSLNKGTKPIWPVLNLNRGGEPPWTVLRFRYIMCDIYWVYGSEGDILWILHRIPNHNSLLQSLNKNLQAKIFSVRQ